VRRSGAGAWTGAVCAGFAALTDRYLAARGADVREIGDRLLRILLDVPWSGLAPASGRSSWSTRSNAC
jgi:phosphoenolpyruvate-protein kinase (PTS system EI component)